MSMATLRFICGLVLVGLVFLSFTLESAEARYMPTRADPVRREQIRELIKAVSNSKTINYPISHCPGS